MFLLSVACCWLDTKYLRRIFLIGLFICLQSDYWPNCLLPVDCLILIRLMFGLFELLIDRSTCLPTICYPQVVYFKLEDIWPKSLFTVPEAGRSQEDPSVFREDFVLTSLNSKKNFCLCVRSSSNGIQVAKPSVMKPMTRCYHVWKVPWRFLFSFRLGNRKIKKKAYFTNWP